MDRAVASALAEAVALYPEVRLEVLDAMDTDLSSLLDQPGWLMVSNLPYNVSVPLVMRMLERVPQVHRYLVMVQREVGERLVARPGEESYGSVSVRVAYRARARIVRRIPADVFWPRPKVDSVLVRLEPHPPAVDVDRDALFRVIEEGFAQRRKTRVNAVRRLGLPLPDAIRILGANGIEPSTRAERLGLEAFADVARSLLAEGWRP